MAGSTPGATRCDRVVYDTTVTGIAWRGRDRVVDSGRTARPFTVHTTDAHGIPARHSARAVVDASGTFGDPNPLGADGYPADGEVAHSESVSYRIPDLRNTDDQARYAGRRTAVVGSGHSSLTALLALATLVQSDPATRSVWVLRRGAVEKAYDGGPADELPARGALGVRVKEAVANGLVEVVHGFRTRAVKSIDAHLRLVSEDGRWIDELDEVIGLTGFRPDHSISTELRLTLDRRLEAPAQLAPLVDPNVHSCGTVSPHGAAELAHEEERVFLVGMKSYGRAPTLLAMTGYEQARSVAAALAGDHEAAARAESTLPETGVCGGAGLFDADHEFPDAAEGCCTPAPTFVQLGVGAPAPPRDRPLHPAPPWCGT